MNSLPSSATAAAGEPADDDATSGVHVWLVLRKAYLALGEHAGRQIDSLAVGQSEFRVLEMLLSKGPQPVNVIGPKVHLTSGSISTAIERLVRKGMVRRRESDADRRLRLVELTPEGRTLIERGFQDHRNAMEAAMLDLTKAERQVLLTLLRKLGKGAEARAQALSAIE